MHLKQQLDYSNLDEKNSQKFYNSFQSYINFQRNKPVIWTNFVALDNKLQYQNLPWPSDHIIKALLQKIVVCKLNGGLATSMNCNQPKSSIILKEGKSFLDITLLQHCFIQKKWQTRIPFLLMNSFYTKKNTQEKILPYQKKIDFHLITQSCYPRIEKLEDGSYQLLEEKEFGEKAFYPPGHGDIFFYLQENLLEKLLKQNKKYLFLSNIDNLGATIDFAILHHLQVTNCPFLMETVPKNFKDTKGGSLLKNSKTKSIKLLETAEINTIPKNYWDKLANNLTSFNTNNLWINLPKLRQEMQKDSWKLDLIKNYKTIANKKILQLETVMGSAISNFTNAQILEVPRKRFLPVKKMMDLELLRSKSFILQKEKGYLLTQV